MKHRIVRIIRWVCGARKPRPHSLFRPCHFDREHRPCRYATEDDCAATLEQSLECRLNTAEDRRAIEWAIGSGEICSLYERCN